MFSNISVTRLETWCIYKYSKSHAAVFLAPCCENPFRTRQHPGRMFPTVVVPCHEEKPSRDIAEQHFADNETKSFSKTSVTPTTTLWAVNNFYYLGANFEVRDILDSVRRGVSDSDIIYAVLCVSLQLICKHVRYKDIVETSTGFNVYKASFSRPVCVPPLYSSASPRVA